MPTNGVKNSPFTPRGIKLADGMLGKSKYAAEGKTARSQPGPAEREAMVELPVGIQNCYVGVELCADALHVDQIRMLQRLQFSTLFGRYKIV